jgi:hypothetical protein
LLRLRRHPTGAGGLGSYSARRAIKGAADPRAEVGCWCCLGLAAACIFSYNLLRLIA